MITMIAAPFYCSKQANQQGHSLAQPRLKFIIMSLMMMVASWLKSY